MDGTRAEELVERYADAILRIGYTLSLIHI